MFTKVQYFSLTSNANVSFLPEYRWGTFVYLIKFHSGGWKRKNGGREWDFKQFVEEWLNSGRFCNIGEGFNAAKISGAKILFARTFSSHVIRFKYRLWSAQKNFRKDAAKNWNNSMILFAGFTRRSTGELLLFTFQISWLCILFPPRNYPQFVAFAKILWNISINVKNLLKFIHIITSPRHQKSQRTLYPTNPHAFIHCSTRKNAPNGEAKLHAFLFLILNALWHISTHFIYKESEKNDWYREFKTMLIGRRTAPVYSRLREKSKPKTAITTQNQISGAHIVNFPI